MEEIVGNVCKSCKGDGCRVCGYKGFNIRKKKHIKR